MRSRRIRKDAWHTEIRSMSVRMVASNSLSECYGRRRKYTVRIEGIRYSGTVRKGHSKNLMLKRARRRYNRIVRSTWRLNIFLLIVAVGVVGCQQPQEPVEGPLVEGPRGINVYELAQMLGLNVKEIAPTHFTLGDAVNTVLVFTYDGGKLYVNGSSLGKVGDVRVVNRSTRLPDSLVGRIKPRLKSAPARRPVPAPTPRRSASGRVVIDPGHGGRDPGASATNGYSEKTINLAVARKVAGLLRQSGVDVVMTRDGDNFIELNERAAISNRVGADLFVSIHADSCGDSGVQGFTVYVAEAGSWPAKRAAEMIAGGMESAGVESRGVRTANYRVLVRTQSPAVLVELGYLSNHWEADRLVEGSYQYRLANAIADGIVDYLN